MTGIPLMPSVYGCESTSLQSSTARREGVRNGEFYFPVGRVGRKVRENMNERLAAELWEWTQKELENWN